MSVTVAGTSPYLHSTISFLEVDEGIVFQFLHPLQLAKLTEGLFKYLLCHSAGQVSHKQHLDLVIGTRFFSRLLYSQKKKHDCRNSEEEEEKKSDVCYWWHLALCLTLAMTSGSGSSMGSAHSTVTTFPHTFTLPLISRRRAWAAVLWSSYSKKQKPRFFFLSSGWWYNMTSFRPSVETVRWGEGKKMQQVVN